jgi:hypothetical protein
MKNIKYQAIQTIKKSNAHIYDYSLSWFNVRIVSECADIDFLDEVTRN